MRYPVVITLVVCLALSASAHGPGRGRGGRGGGRGGPGRGGFLRFCSCNSWFNPCRGNTGSTVRGCPETNQFIQCTDATCAVETCPTGQVWNKTQNACAACLTGWHVRTDGQACVCDRGTRYDFKTRSCQTCPTGAIIEDDTCYCPTNMAFDKENNQCRLCPAETRLARGGCYCTDPQLFWNAGAWECQPCPGEWLPRENRWYRFFHSGRQECLCNSTENETFNRRDVSCYTCPAGTEALRDTCRCDIRGQWFNFESGQCECHKRLVLNTEGTACVRDTTEGTGGTGGETDEDEEPDLP